MAQVARARNRVRGTARRLAATHASVARLQRVWGAELVLLTIAGADHQLMHALGAWYDQDMIQLRHQLAPGGPFLYGDLDPLCEACTRLKGGTP